jgi:hypothetical protein
MGGRRSASADGATSRMRAGSDWRDAREQERVDRFPDGHAGERAELEGIARRFEGARLVDRAGSRRRRWRARLLESSRRDVPGNASSTMLAAQDVERARQVSEIRSAQCTQRPARNLAGAGSGDGRDGDWGAEKYAPKYDKAVECLAIQRMIFVSAKSIPRSAVNSTRSGD